MHTCVYLLRVHMTKNTYIYKIHICKSKYTPGLSRCKLTFTYMQLRSHAQKYTRVQIIHKRMYNLHTVCKSAHVNGALDELVHLEGGKKPALGY